MASEAESAPHPGFRIFILGAGFSRPAGLPLASELFLEVRKRIESRHGKDTKFQRDLENYIEYRSVCDGVSLDEDGVDLEEFMSFLDIEHFLQLRGSDTWSDEGNESQLMLRKTIGEIVHERTPARDRLPNAYYKFAERLSLHDVVLTLNYDIVLERALEHIGKPFRLFPDRYSRIGSGYNVVDSSVEEVVLLKLHGSVDWFSDREFLKIKSSLRNDGSGHRSNIHSVFDDPSRYGARPLVDGLRDPEDSLLHIHKISNPDSYYRYDEGFNAPFILSPSHVKFVYAEPLMSFWRGMGRAGGYNLGVSIIGFSLPKHDEYIRIGLFQMISNYWSWWDQKMVDRLKDNVRLVDFQNDDAKVAAYKARYGFVDPARAEYFLEGFGDDAIEFLFDHPRAT